MAAGPSTALTHPQAHPADAAWLVISGATVKTHINNLFAKADPRSPTDVVRYALRTERSRAEP